MVLDVDIEQLDFKDCISHPRLHVQSVERKRNSRYFSQDKKLAKVTLHDLLVMAVSREERS